MGNRQDISSQPGSISSMLLDQVRRGQPQAWERMVRLYSPLIYRWCRRSGVPAEDSADLLQDVFAAVMLKLPTFRRERPADSFTAWLATITRNKIRDYYRRLKHRPQGRGGTTAQKFLASVPEPAEPLEESVQSDQDSAVLLSRRAAELIQAEFEPRTWQAFLKTAVQQQVPGHVAEELGMSVAAVYMAKSRVLRRLREVLGELGS